MGPAVKKHYSMTFTALIWAGILLVLVGTAMTAFGLRESSAAIEVSWGKGHIKTGHVGLAIASIGALLAGLVAVRLPRDVRVFSGASDTNDVDTMAKRLGIPFVVVGTIALMTLIAMLL